MLKRLLPSGTLSFAAAVALFFSLQLLANWDDVSAGFRDGWNEAERDGSVWDVDAARQREMDANRARAESAQQYYDSLRHGRAPR